VERAYLPVDDQTDSVPRAVVDCAMTVHKALGPGFLERAYERALHLELEANGIESGWRGTARIYVIGRVESPSDARGPQARGDDEGPTLVISPAGTASRASLQRSS